MKSATIKFLQSLLIDDRFKGEYYYIYPADKKEILEMIREGEIEV